MRLKVIACEIAARELRHLAAGSSNRVDLQLLPQGHHNNPDAGRPELQKAIDSVPEGCYDSIVLGYGLCSRMLSGIRSNHTRLVVPRAHDCITLFLGSRKAYQEGFAAHPDTYYFTSGWLECAEQASKNGSDWHAAASPANSAERLQAAYEEWTKKYGEDQAAYLLDETKRWAQSYSYGCLIDFDFLQPLKLDDRVRAICADKGWTYTQIPGSFSLLDRLLNGPWSDAEFLVLNPHQEISASYDDRIIEAKDTGRARTTLKSQWPSIS